MKEIKHKFIFYEQMHILCSRNW